MRILVAEDDPGIGELIDVTMTHLGHAVTVVADGQSALDTFAEQPFDVVLLDVMMPGMTGLTVLKEIRRHETRKDVAVVLLTAQTSEDAHVRGFRDGADAYLTKPFRPRELEAALTAVVAKSPEKRRADRRSELERAELLRRLESRF